MMHNDNARFGGSGGSSNASGGGGGGGSVIDSRSSRAVHLSGLPDNWRHSDLHKFFTKFYGQGNIISIRPYPNSRNEAVVEFLRPDEARKVVRDSPLNLYERDVSVGFYKGPMLVGSGSSDNFSSDMQPQSMPMRGRRSPPGGGGGMNYNNGRSFNDNPRYQQNQPQRTFSSNNGNYSSNSSSYSNTRNVMQQSRQPQQPQQWMSRGRSPPPVDDGRYVSRTSSSRPSMNNNGAGNYVNNNSGMSSGMSMSGRSSNNFDDFGSMNRRRNNADYAAQQLEHNDECHTLFVGNLDEGIQDSDLKAVFKQYGLIQEIDIKRSNKAQTPYSFIRFLTMDMARRAKEALNQTRVGGSQLRIGYGKAKVSSRLWVGGLGPGVTEDVILPEFERYGNIRNMMYSPGAPWAFIEYESQDAATAAWQEMKGFEIARNRRLKIDYAELDDPYLPEYKAPIDAVVDRGSGSRGMSNRSNAAPMANSQMSSSRGRVDQQQMPNDRYGAPRQLAPGTRTVSRGGMTGNYDRDDGMRMNQQQQQQQQRPMGNRQMSSDGGTRSMGNNNYDNILDNYEQQQQQRPVQQRRVNSRRSTSNDNNDDDGGQDANANVPKRRRDDGAVQQQQQPVRRRNDSFSPQQAEQPVRSQQSRTTSNRGGTVANEGGDDEDVVMSDQPPVQRRRRAPAEEKNASPARGGDPEADEDVTPNKKANDAAETRSGATRGDVEPSMSPPTPPDVSTFREYRERAQHVWEGSLQLKATNFDVQCYHVDGSTRWINDILGPDLQTPLKITQRLRLEERKLEDVRERISAKESALVLAYNSGKRQNGTTAGGDGAAKSNTSGIEELEGYLKQKDAAGVAYCKPAIVYIFPTCSFADSLLQQRIPSLRAGGTKKKQNKSSTVAGGDSEKKKSTPVKKTDDEAAADDEKKPAENGNKSKDGESAKKDVADETKQEKSVEADGEKVDENTHADENEDEEEDDKALLMVILDSDQ